MLLTTVAVTSAVLTQLGHFNVAVTVATLYPVTRGTVWTLMNAPLTLTAVAKYVPTQMERLVVAATVDSRWPAMEGHAQRTMSAPWGLTTASNVVSTLRVDSDVNATLASSSTQIKALALVRSLTFFSVAQVVDIVSMYG